MTGEHAEKACETALALLGDTQPLRRSDLLNLLVGLADVVGDRSAQAALHGEIAAVLQRHPVDTSQAELLFGRALLAERLGETTTTKSLARQSLEVAERCGAARWAALAQAQLAWMHFARGGLSLAAGHIELGLHWAARIEGEPVRGEVEGQLLIVSAMSPSPMHAWARHASA